MLRSNPFFIAIFMISLGIACNTESPSHYIHRENDFILFANQNIFATSFVEINNIENTVVKEIQSLGLNMEQVKYIYSGRGLLTPVFDDFDFGLLTEVSIWVVGTKDPSLRKEIYYRDQIPLSQKNELKLQSGLADLSPFFQEEEKYNLEIQFKFRNFVPQNFDMRFTYSFAIFTN